MNLDIRALQTEDVNDPLYGDLTISESDGKLVLATSASPFTTSARS
jgi:hypothetical protein